jgi:predicted Zn-ribbon and HTH transcriptional regulator
VSSRRDILAILATGPHSASSLARALGLGRDEIEDELRHAIRSAQAAGHAVIVEPARCKACGFTFGESKLTKPGRCPQCRQSRIYEPMIGLGPGV